MAKLNGYIGTYSEGAGKSKGIYSFTMDGETGIIEEIALAAESKNPSYLALSPSKKFLYAVNEVGKYEDTPYGAVSAYAVQTDRSLKFLNRKSSEGAGPCHVVIHKGGAFVVAANYSSGVLTVLPVAKTGKLGNPVQSIQYEGTGPNEKRQERAHAHSFTFAPDFANGFACDLGSDKVMLYRFDPKAKQPLVPWKEPFVAALPGYGPRHGVFHPKGQFAYVLNELKSAVDVFAFADPGAGSTAKAKSTAGPSFRWLQTIPTLPKGSGKVQSIGAAIRISPNGKFLYTSNRGHDSIAIFKVQPAGLLELVDTVPSGGKNPRDFTLDPEGNFLLVMNQNSDNMAVFKINRRTGLLKKEREYSVLSPTGIIFC
jgi:6-phosphogluconolactonase